MKQLHVVFSIMALSLLAAFSVAYVRQTLSDRHAFQSGESIQSRYMDAIVLLRGVAERYEETITLQGLEQAKDSLESVLDDPRFVNVWISAPTSSARDSRFFLKRSSTVLWPDKNVAVSPTPGRPIGGAFSYHSDQFLWYEARFSFAGQERGFGFIVKDVNGRL